MEKQKIVIQILQTVVNGQTETGETGSCKIKGDFSCAGKEGNCVDPCMMINRRCALNHESNFWMAKRNQNVETLNNALGV